MLDRRGTELFCERGKIRFASGAIVRKYTNLDQAVGLESHLDFFHDRSGQALAANDGNRREVVGLSAFFFALGRCEVNGWHTLL